MESEFGGGGKMSFAGLVKELRLAQTITLRQFCMKHGYDPSNWSKIERGINRPPKDPDELARWARDLGLRKGQEQWRQFMDEAAIARRELPQDIISDKKLAGLLPVFFRTVRGADAKGEALNDFVEKLRRAYSPDKVP